MTQTAKAMECPRCKEIALRVTDEEPRDDTRMVWLHTYECDECGHIEIHTEGVPSWHTEGTT